MTRVRFLDHIRAVLTEAVLAGAGRVLRVRREALSAGANILMVVFGGQDVYANLGAGNELDIAPGQVIAQEAASRCARPHAVFRSGMCGSNR